MEHVISKKSVPPRPEVSNLNSLLHDVYVRHVALKEEEFRLHYRVFTEIFAELQNKMKQVDKYYERYASDVKYAGSHYDNIRIKKPDEFDMIIVINLPPCNSGLPFNDQVEIQPQFPGYVQLRTRDYFSFTVAREVPDSQIQATVTSWIDSKRFLLSSKFISWFKSVGVKALNQFKHIDALPALNVDGVNYKIKTSESGPAWTIKIEAPGFNLDIDLVPALKFPEHRWLRGKRIRPIPEKCKKDYWIVVAKPNKDGHTEHDMHRSWRIGMQDQEREFLNNTYALRQTIRLVKQLRDSLDMHKLTSYYIKNLFFIEIAALGKKHPAFWEKNDIGKLFTHMVEKLYDALLAQRIPYFWNRRQNFIGKVNYATIVEYRSKVSDLRTILRSSRSNRYKEVAKYLLTPSEYLKYQKLLA